MENKFNLPWYGWVIFFASAAIIALPLWNIAVSHSEIAEAETEETEIIEVWAAGDSIPDPVLPDDAEFISRANVTDWITNFYNWAGEKKDYETKAYRYDTTVLQAMRYQNSEMVEGQKGVRVYFGLTNELDRGRDIIMENARLILVPFSSVGEDILPEEYNFIAVRANENNWRPCPPYCDGERGLFSPE